MCVIPSLSRLHRAENLSRVHLKCGLCIWNLLLSTLNMRSTELSFLVKQVIIRPKNQNKSIRDRTVGAAKSPVGNILKKEHTVSSAAQKDPEDQ